MLVACRERPADLREWKATDHDHTDNPNSGQVQVDPSASATPAIPGLEDVTIVAWQQNCTPCHGQLGRGDGPRGPMLKATNLADPAWQAAASDEQIARAIKEGKGAMPPFKLPDGTIANLVKLVRMMNAARLGGAHGEKAAAAPSGSAATAPSSSAAPAAHPETTKHGAPSGSAPKSPVTTPSVAPRAPVAVPATPGAP